MPYDVLANMSGEDGLKYKTITDMVNSRIAQQQQTPEADEFMRQANLYANMPVDYTGNINLANRPQVNMPDGSIATVRSMSFNDNGKERLIPTISQSGQALSPEQAIAEYQRTGQHLGLFNNVADANAMAQRIHEQQASGLGNTQPTPTVQPTNKPVSNSVFSQTQRAEKPVQIPSQPATVVASQGVARKPTTEEYTAYAIDYLAKKGYDYDEAMALMKPSIAKYQAEENAEKRAKADMLIAEMQNQSIDSPQYRQNALQLLRVDPTMGQLMWKEGFGPRDQYLRAQKVADAQTAMQNKLNYARANAGFQLENLVRKQQAMDAYKQQQFANTVNMLMTNYGFDKNTAVNMALGGGNRRGYGGASQQANSGIPSTDLKAAETGIKALEEEYNEGKATNPNFQLSPEKQQMYNIYKTIQRRHMQELGTRYGYAQPQQQVRYDVNNPNSFKPLVQAMVQKNGKFDKNVAMVVRKMAGVDPNNTNPNEPVNIMLKKEYGFSG